MPSKGTEFPIFLKTEYQPDPSIGPKIAADIDRGFNQANEATRRFAAESAKVLEGAFRLPRGGLLSGLESVLADKKGELQRFNIDAQRILANATTSPRLAGGALDVGADKIRAQGAAYQSKAVAARELATATEAAARSAGQLDAATQRAVAGLRQEAAVQDEAARSTLQHAVAVERIQVELGRQAAATNTAAVATGRAAAANDNARVSAGQHRAALSQLNFQIGDIAQGLALGTPPAIIFAQQAGQVGQAVSLMGGSARGVGAFLGGPWGIFLTTATVVLAPFIGKLFETAGAADQVNFATNAVGDAQSILGGVLDIATGKINTQSSALIGLAKAQLLVAKVQATARAADARRGVADIQSRPVRFTGGGLGGGFSAGRRDVDARDTISAGVLGGSLDSATAVQRLENLRRVGRLTDEEFTAAASSVANLGIELRNLAVYDDAGKLLAGTGGRSLLKPAKAKTPRKPRTGDGGAAAREEFGEDTADRVAGIAEQFSRVPSAVRDAIKTTRTLSDLIDDLARKRPVNFEATIADAKAARGAIADAIVRPFEDAQRNADRQFEVQRLTLAGRNAEAAALESIFALEDKLGSEEVLRAKAAELIAKNRKDEAAVIEQILAAYPQLKQQARDLANLEERRGEALKRAQVFQNAYLDATRSIRGEVEALLSGTGKLGNFKQIFRQLQGKILTEQIFGPIFDKLEKTVLKDTGIDAAVEKLAADTTRAGNSALSFADTLDEATRRISGAVPGEATLGNASAAGAGPGFLAAIVGGASATGTAGNAVQGGLQPNGDILVLRDRPSKDTVAGMTPGNYADLVANELTRPLLKGLDGLIPGLSGVIGGALSGYVTGGIPGGIIGALKNVGGLSKGIDGLPNAFGKVLGKAGEGAAAGTAIAGLAKAFGFKKFSTTGSQIGGAIGSALPIPGGQIIGSIIGGTIGGLFKKTKTGSATLSIGADGVGVGSTSGNSKSLKGTASSAGDSIGDALNRIAEQLGGTASGAIGVSIGVRNKSFRVDTTGAGRTKGAGVLDFGQDQAAAVKAAIADAIKDGVIQGISAGAQRLIQSGKDIDKQLQKALSFEGTLARAKALRDPVGAALDTLDKEFTRLRSIFTEAGASVAEYADLEKLYGAERAQAVKQATESLTGSLRGLLDDLTIGNDALSLRDRKSAALAKFDPLEARVKAGDTTAFDDYATAARSLLDIERQFSGSQGGYFALLDQVRATTQGRLDGFDAIAASSIGRDSPFASNPLPADNVNVVNAIADQTRALLDGLGTHLSAVNSNLGALIARTGITAEPQLLRARGYF